jgi:hypothetical protein
MTRGGSVEVEERAGHPVGRGRRARWALAVGVVALAAVAAAVVVRARADDEPVSAVASPSPQDHDATASHPFTVGAAPEGYRLLAAGQGTDVQDWGDDSMGTDEPFTVLEGDGGAVMAVSVTGYAGYQSALEQASAGFTVGMPEPEPFELDGDEALYTPSKGGRWADLVVARDDDLAVRVTAPGVSRDDLVEVARSVQPSTDPGRAPEVDGPPEPWRVVGSAHIDAVLALQASFDPAHGPTPGPESAHFAAWLAGDGSIVAMTVPGSALDLAALRSDLPFFWPPLGVTAEAVEIDGRPGVVLDHGGDRPGREVVTVNDAGDVVVVAASGSVMPAVPDLVDLAGSVRPADEAAWEAFVLEARGTQGPSPDPGAVEIARGQAGGVDWLLQTTDSEAASILTPDAVTGRRPDACLVVANGRRACAHDGYRDVPDTSIATMRAPDPAAPGLPSFMLVVTTVEGAKLRVPTATGSITADLHPLPDGGRVAVVFTEEVDTAWCADGTSPGPRFEVLDAADVVVDCLG